MIERKDTHDAATGTDKANSTSLASEVYQWGAHKVDDAKSWAKEHPKTALAAEAATLAAGAGLVYVATKGHGGQKLAAEALEDAGAVGAKAITRSGAESGAVLAKDALSLAGNDTAAMAKGFSHTLEHSVGQPGVNSASAMLRSVEADAANTAKVLPATIKGEADAAATTAAKSGAVNFDATAGKVATSADSTVANLGAKSETAAASEQGWFGHLPKWARVGVPVLTAGGLSMALAGCDQSPDDGSNNTTTIGGDSATPPNPEDEKPEEARVYHNVKECAADGVYTENFCQTEFDKAKQTNLQIAPKFDTQEQCESETGTKCEATPDAQALVTNPSAGGDSTQTPPAVDANGQPIVAGQQPQGDGTVQQQQQPGATTVVVQEHHSSFVPFMYGYMMGQNSSSGYVSRPLYSSPSSGGFITPEGRDIGAGTGRVSVPAASMSRATVGVGEAGHVSTGTSRGVFGGAARGGAAGFGG